MIHLYYGEGKGKTTAAVGLAARASGAGMTVLFAQFFKDGTSAEIASLDLLPGIETLHPALHCGRYKTMSEQQRSDIRESYSAMFSDIVRGAGKYDLIVLDEAVSAAGYGMIDEGVLADFLTAEGGRREIVLTGRRPSQTLLSLADYATEMRKEKHPFDKGIGARRGIEY